MIKKCINCSDEFKLSRNAKYCQKCSPLFRNTTRLRMIRNREFVTNYKKNRACTMCNYDKFPEILIFHHKNKQLKSGGINNLMKTLKNINTIKAEMEKCILLCPNCHSELHLEEVRGLHEK